MSDLTEWCFIYMAFSQVIMGIFFSRHKEARGFKPVTLPGQEAAADYQVNLLIHTSSALGRLPLTSKSSSVRQS